MIVVALNGGIGNQLFHYAAARALALRLGVSVGLDRRWYDGRQGRHYALDRFAIRPATVDPGVLPFRDGKISGAFSPVSAGACVSIARRGSPSIRAP